MNEIRKIRVDLAVSGLVAEIEHIMRLLSIYDDRYDDKTERNNKIFERMNMNVSTIKRLLEI